MVGYAYVAQVVCERGVLGIVGDVYNADGPDGIIPAMLTDMERSDGVDASAAVVVLISYTEH
jgi:hypothetical protein